MTHLVSRVWLFIALAAGLAGCANTPPPAPSPAQPATASTQPAAMPDADTKPSAPVAVQASEVAPVPPSVYPTGPLTPISVAEASRMAVMQLAAPGDLWERIRRGFAMPNLASDLVGDREQWYTTRPDYIFRMTERSRKYLFHIVEELELRNMPTELALLPFIESAFNPQAVSSAKAAGMWQFMPATGKYFELKQNAFRDDRRDVLASTRAALDYLQKLHNRFGDWHLALAAYNWGEGSVSRAMTKNKNTNLGTGYLDLQMPVETRFYVPKLQAVKNIVATPQTFNSTLPLIGNHPFFQTVGITRDIDVALAARLADVSVEDFKALNPSVNRPVILAAGTPQILLPWDQAAIFQRNLDRYTGVRLASWTVWVAPTTLKTAEAARRTGMTESELREVNSIPLNVMIHAGSTLLVPRGSRISSDVAVHVADHGQIALSPEILTRRTLVKAGKNDTLASVAKRHNLSAATVAEWNKLHAGSALKVGQQLVLHLPFKGNVVARASTRSSAKYATRLKGTSKVTSRAKSTKVAKR